MNLSGENEFKNRVVQKLKRELGDLVLNALEDDLVVEIMLNTNGSLWVEKIGEPMRQIGRMSESVARSLLGTIASYHESVINAENPILECELPIDGSRFEGIMPPNVERPVFTIRKKAIAIFSLSDYVASGVMSERQKEIIEDAIKERKNILIIGGTGSGKTTLANGIINSIVELTPEHRIIIIEDTAEIQCSAQNAVIMRSNINADMLRLLKVTMRLRPDRILIGEVRGKEALSLLKAWNTGHPGGIATIHANSAADGLIRLEQLISEDSLTPMQKLIASAVNVLVFIKKTPIGRQVNDILEVLGYDAISQAYQFKQI